MTENENKEEKEKPQEITQDKIIDPKDYTEQTEESVKPKDESIKPGQPAPTTPEAPPGYKDHVLTKAVNQFTPLVINRLILKCPDCEKVTQEEIEATGLGEALAWCADKYLPQVPTNTPAAALIASSFAVAGLVAMKHPKVKHYLEGIEQQAGA